MSLQGKYTPLSINVVTGLIKNEGLRINPSITDGSGISNSPSHYTKGGFATSNSLSDAIRLAWTKIGGNVSQTTYNNLIAIGSTTIPALGNSPPNTFTISYSPFLYDSWLLLGEQNNFRFNHQAPTNNTITPSTGRSPYVVKIDGVTVSSTTYSVNNNLLSFTTSPPKGSKVEIFTDEGSSYGFLRILALQASKEFYYYKGTYPHFVSSFAQANSMTKQLNKTINSITNSVGFLNGTYSNMNDLITGDVTGVSLATLSFGQDLIRLGKSLNLKRLDNFGSPYHLLITLQENNAITESVNIALISAGLATEEILDLTQETVDPTIEQEKKIYEAFKLIMNEELTEVLIPLNVQTENLNSLADLLDVAKLFPVSRNSLTTPIYNTTSSRANSKIYQFIFSGKGTNGALLNKDYGTDLKVILPENIAVANDAFKRSMLQIKNITTMDIEKFAQVVTNMEPVSDITGIGGTTTPNDPSYINPAIQSVAKGSGVDGSYILNDFFGAMSGIPYKITRINQLVLELQTNTLKQIYTNMLTELNISRNNDSVLNTLITQANTEISNIRNAKSALAQELNTLWANLGSQLTIEMNARNSFITPNDSANQLDLYSFVEHLDNYAEDTKYGMAAATLEKISDITIGGKSIIAAMREARNAKRLGLAGGVLDNDVPDDKPATSSGNLGVPKVTGAAMEPGSFAGSDEIQLIPSNLDIFDISSNVIVQINTVEAATQEVIDCNCDCWDDIENL